MPVVGAGGGARDSGAVTGRTTDGGSVDARAASASSTHVVTDGLRPAFKSLSRSFRTRAKSPMPTVRPWTGGSAGSYQPPPSPLRPPSEGLGPAPLDDIAEASPTTKRGKKRRGKGKRPRRVSRGAGGGRAVDPVDSRLRSRQNPAGESAGNMSFVRLDPNSSAHSNLVEGWRQHAAGSGDPDGPEAGTGFNGGKRKSAGSTGWFPPATLRHAQAAVQSPPSSPPRAGQLPPTIPSVVVRRNAQGAGPGTV